MLIARVFSAMMMMMMMMKHSIHRARNGSPPSLSPFFSRRIPVYLKTGPARAGVTNVFPFVALTFEGFAHDERSCPRNKSRARVT